MKNTCKRTLSLLLALLLAVSLWVPAYAAAEGEITITYKAPGGTASTYELSFPGAEDLKTGFTILPGTKIPYSKLLPMEGKETANSITTDVVWMNWKTAAGDLIYPNTTIQDAIELRGAAKISKESALKVTFTPDAADGGTENANPWYFYLRKEDSSNENTEAWSNKFPSQANGFPAGFWLDGTNGEVWYDASNEVEATLENAPHMEKDATFTREFKVTLHYLDDNKTDDVYTTDKKLGELPTAGDGYQWSASETGYTAPPEAGETLTESIHLYALKDQEEEKSVTITIDCNYPDEDHTSGAGIVICPVQYVEDDKENKIMLEELTSYSLDDVNGYIFRRWVLTYNGIPYEIEDTVSIPYTEGVNTGSAKAIWEASTPPTTVTITWDPNGGTWTNGTIGTEVKKDTYQSGDKIIVPTDKDLSRSEKTENGDPMYYYFVGWAEAKDGTTSVTIDTANRDATYYAIWDIEQPPQPGIKHTVSFTKGADDAIGTPPAPEWYTEGEIFCLPDNPFDRAGYSFVGWNDGVMTYAAGTQYVMPNGDVTFTARWTKDADPPQPEDKYTVFFTSGTDTVSETHAAGDTFQLPANPFYREGYFFTGWNDGEKTYGSGWRYTMPDHDVVFTAQWEENLIPIFPPPSIGDSGGQSRPVYYPITAPSDVAVPGGSVTLDAKSASAGSIVTITAVPDAGYEVDYITVLDRDGYEVELTDRGNGVYTFVMPGSKVNVEYAFKPAGEVPEQPEQPDQPEQPVQPAPDMPFADVGSGDWFHDAVQYVYNAGLMKGDGSETVFNPGGKVNRAMVWMILGRLSGADVDGSDGVWYAKAQAWAMAAGVTDGTDPTGCITREQMVTMLWRYFGSPAAAADLGVFSDSDAVSAWALDAMCWAVSTGLVNGENNRLNPGDDAARAQVAALLMRFCQSTEILPG